MPLPHASHVLGAGNVGVNRQTGSLPHGAHGLAEEIDINPPNHYSVTFFINAREESKERKGVQ